ncbi:rod shape-determining protein MreD [Shouchella lonarensis]|uniref:Rod shape-determining protein MreD n=1 Tax=Shouchella lonarensis TaxID=1464122 RepID=A0A1G6GI28_9BACI|nr:rod shape-determining protein MreD [Shouchella lonarensis]SDB81559.1 rod shape-determining protein MreD [Shouchella lonarensis]
MSRTYFSFVIVGLFVLEGALVSHVLQAHTTPDQIVVPRFVLIIVVMIGLFTNGRTGLLYGLAFGLMYDIVYTNLLGVYAFGFACLGYVFGLYQYAFRASSFWVVLLSIAGVVLFEYYQYGIFSMLGKADLSGSTFLTSRLFPTVVFNGAFAMLVVLPFRKLALHVLTQASIRER